MDVTKTPHHWLAQQDFPKQYDLRATTDGSRVGFRIHPAVWESITKLFMNADKMAAYASMIGHDNSFSAFTPRDGSGKPWGFGERLVEDMSGNWPIIEALCPEADVGNFDAGACLSLVQSAISLFEDEIEETPEEGKQPMVVDGFRVERGVFYGGSVWFSVSPWFRKRVQEYVKGFGESDGEVWASLWHREQFDLPVELQHVLEVMRNTYRYVHPIRQEEGQDMSFLDHDFRANLRDSGGFHLEVPGDACGLDPEHHFWTAKEDEGFKLVPHNTDAACDQLGLFAGVAQLVKELS